MFSVTGTSGPTNSLIERAGFDRGSSDVQTEAVPLDHREMGHSLILGATEKGTIL